MDKARLIYLIQKSRSGEIAQEEQDELESYWLLAQNDDTYLSSFSGAEKKEMRKNILDGIRAGIRALEEDQPAGRTMIPASKWMLRVAASVTLILMLTLYWSRFAKVGSEYQTAYGEHLTIQLPDESKVVINGNSAIRFDPEWAEDGDREVWIDGEAYFEVVHTANHRRFIVHTENGMDVQVLGTKFNVKTRRGKTEVMLQEGKVRVDVAKPQLKETMTLQPGELATLENSTLLKERIEPRQYAAWKENKLFFDQTPLRDIAILLEDTYGIEVVFESDEIASRKLSGEIASEDAADILKAVEETLNVTITHEGQRAVFH